MTKNPFCIPRLRRPTTAARKNSRSLSPMSLLDRLRDAVFRFILLSSLSKNVDDTPRSSSSQPSDRYFCPNDPYHSEAVADCIEFIKKSSSATHQDSAQVVIPLPVI